MEIIVQIIALLLSVILAVVKSMRFAPSGLSEFELGRLAHTGNAHALAEQDRRLLLPTFISLQYLKETAILAALAALLLLTQSPVAGTLLVALYVLVAYVITARGWVAGIAAGLQRWFERAGSGVARRLAPFLRWLAPKPGQVTIGVASREELRALIEQDDTLLSPQDRSRLLGALDFGGQLVQDVMVPRDRIATVDYTDTVGPLLLDRLHKDGHNMFVVVKKDLDHVKGWLYMADLVPLDPELKEVKDAVRQTVHFLPAHAPLEEVLAASLLTGRQIFIVVDDAGHTKGLVTLADTLAQLNGTPIPKISTVQTHP